MLETINLFNQEDRIDELSAEMQLIQTNQLEYFKEWT